MNTAIIKNRSRISEPKTTQFLQGHRDNENCFPTIHFSLFQWGVPRFQSKYRYSKFVTSLTLHPIPNKSIVQSENPCISTPFCSSWFCFFQRPRDHFNCTAEGKSSGLARRISIFFWNVFAHTITRSLCAVPEWLICWKRRGEEIKTVSRGMCRCLRLEGFLD